MSFLTIPKQNHTEVEKIEKRKSGFRAALIAILLTKLSKLAKLAKLVKLLKFSKIFIMLTSMLVSAIAYSWLRGPWFAIGLVIMLFVHEMGHVIALRRRGLPTNLPIFIPMLGAVIFAPPLKDRETEAVLGIGGPLLGGIRALLALIVWAWLPSHPPIVLVISFVGFYLNLLNLIPIRPLDGGRITQAGGSWLKYIGGTAILLLPIILRDPSFLLLWIICLPDVRMHPFRRVKLGIGCELAMIAFMVAGFGGQPVWANMLDILLASFINVAEMSRCNALSVAIYEHEQLEKTVTELPLLPFWHRVKWLALYIALAIFLLSMMVLAAPSLPGNI